MGKIIAFSGIDGVGKSTQVAKLESYLKKNKQKVLVTEEMFGYFIVKPIVKHLRKVTDSPSGGPVSRNNNILPKLWFIIALFDIWASYLFKFRPMKRKYDYIIADRFYTDIWANLLYYGYIPSLAYKFLVKVLPKADISIFMTASPEIVLTRENDFPPEYYHEQKKIYEDLALRIDLVMIDANGTPREVSKEIIKHVEKR